MLVAGMALAHAALADFEATGPDGRRILLKDDGTWRYLDAGGKEPPKDKAGETGEAVLRLERRTEGSNSCRFAVQLVNNFPYEIRSFVPTFAAYRSNGVVYDNLASGFLSIRPGASRSQEIQFRGIGCHEIARLQVSGGDRCVMGDLDRWAMPDGACLKRVRVQESDLVRFDK